MDDDMISSEEDFEEPSHRFKSRTQSQDRVSKRSKPKRGHATSSRKWNSLQQDLSSEECALYDEVLSELHGLKNQVDEMQMKNSWKEAMNRIADLEQELQTKDDNSPLNTSLNERESLTKHLQDVTAEVEGCQDKIRRLQQRLGKRNFGFQFENTRDDIDSDINNMQSILQNQKAEIGRLNDVLDQLASRGTAYPNSYQNFPDPLLKNVGNSKNNIPLSNQVPHPLSSYSTPAINNDPVALHNFVPTHNFKGLFCNIPEHHYLEDYYHRSGSRLSSAHKKQKFKSETEKCINTLEVLQDDIARKSEELDNVEIQISKQTGETERLNYQIDQLNYTKQDLLHQVTTLRQEVEHLRRESFSANNENLIQMQTRKSQLSDEINKMENKLFSQKEELGRIRDDVFNGGNRLSQIQSQAGDAIQKFEESKLNQKQLIAECEELEKRSKEASTDLAKAMNDLKDVQQEISTLNSNKINLQDVLNKIQDVIFQKDKDFQKLTDEINKSSKHLSSVQCDLTMYSEQNREKLQMISEGEQLLTDTRLELNRLKKEIMLKQNQLEQLESELGEKTAVVDGLSSEVERARFQHQKVLQEQQQECLLIKREITDLKTNAEDLSDQRNDLIRTIDKLKVKINEYHETMENEEQKLVSLQSEFDKRSWQMQHLDNMIRIKQSQVEKLQLEYQDKLTEVEKSHAEIQDQQIESKKLDSDIKRKMLEMEKLRQTISSENETLQRLKFDLENLETNVMTVTKERNLIQSQNREIEDNLKLLKRQETQTQESMMSMESRLSQIRTEFEKITSDKFTETTKRDELKMQSNSLAKQLYEAKCELQSIRERVTMLESQCDERTSELRKKVLLQNNLNIEIRKLQDQIRLANMSFEEVGKQEQGRKEKILSLDGEMARKVDEVKNMEKKLDDIRHQLEKDERKMELSNLKTEINLKAENIETHGNRLVELRKETAIKEFTEQKIFELEEVIRRNESTIDNYETENRKLSNQVYVLSRDVGNLRETHEYELEKKDKELSKLRKRIAKEIFQLEKLAEEQCQRANSLADDLNQARRDYLLLRNRCLAQEHFIEQQNLFKECINPAVGDRFSVNPRFDLPTNIESALLTEHRRHLSNQLNMFRDNLVAATQSTMENTANKSNNFNSYKKSANENRWNTTSSSGFGSTIDAPGNSSETTPENDRIKKALYNTFSEDIEKINSENIRCENRCRHLRNEVDQLKSSMPKDETQSVCSDE